jgi:hypothetical protein
MPTDRKNAQSRLVRFHQSGERIDREKVNVHAAFQA